MIHLIHMPGIRCYLVSMKLKAIPFPREYGSWGILITSGIMGVALQRGPVTAVTVLALAGISLLFMTKAPLSAFVRRRHGPDLAVSAVYAGGGLLFLWPALSAVRPGTLLLLSVVPVLTIAVYAMSAFLHRERAVVVEFFAMATLTLPVLFFSLAERHPVNVRMSALWFLSFLYFSASILKVKMLIFRTRGFRIANVIYLIAVAGVFAVLIAGRAVPVCAGFAFLPLIENAVSTFVQHDGRRNLKRVGILELVKGCIFALVLILAAVSA